MLLSVQPPLNGQALVVLSSCASHVIESTCRGMTPPWRTMLQPLWLANGRRRVDIRDVPVVTGSRTFHSSCWHDVAVLAPRGPDSMAWRGRWLHCLTPRESRVLASTARVAMLPPVVARGVSHGSHHAQRGACSTYCVCTHTHCRLTPSVSERSLADAANTLPAFARGLSRTLSGAAARGRHQHTTTLHWAACELSQHC